MARNKLTEADFETADRELKSIKCDAVKWTTDSGNIWMVELCKLMAEEHCCVASWIVPRGTRTHTLNITGIGEDPQICKATIEFAVGFVLQQMKVFQRKYRCKDARSYADGFISGLREAYEEQKDEHPEWGLVVVMPQEVEEYSRKLGHKNTRVRNTTFDPLAYLRGQKDGRNFNAQKVLQG